LDRKELKDLVLPPEILGENWNEKLAYSCQAILNLKMQMKFNSQILKLYYQIETILAEKG
ncbi:21563_t:CDS:1, partial [Racocetra persica]